MGELPLLKLVEVLGVAVAGGAFVWWQMRDLKKAQEATRRERKARQACEAKAATLTAPNTPTTPATAALQARDARAADQVSGEGLPTTRHPARGTAERPVHAGQQDTPG